MFSTLIFVPFFSSPFPGPRTVKWEYFWILLYSSFEFVKTWTEAEFLDESRQKSEEFFSFLFTVTCTYSFALRFIFLQTHATFYVFLQFSYWTLQRRKRGKPNRKTYLLPFGFRNLYRYIKSENSQDYAQKPQRNSTFMNSTSVPLHCKPLSAVGNSKPNSNPFSGFVQSEDDLCQKLRKIVALSYYLCKVKNEIQMIKLIQDLTNSVAAAVNGKTKVCFYIS